MSKLLVLSCKDYLSDLQPENIFVKSRFYSVLSPEATFKLQVLQVILYLELYLANLHNTANPGVQLPMWEKNCFTRKNIVPVTIPRKDRPLSSLDATHSIDHKRSTLHVKPDL